MSDEPYQVVPLRNGTWSVRSLAHAETFHPVVGPEAEAHTLYVKQVSLLERLRIGPEPFVVWDVGLGAAANVTTVIQAARSIPARLQITSYDVTAEPLRFALRHPNELSYLSELGPHAARLLESGRACFRHDHLQVDWRFRLGDFPTLLRAGRPIPGGSAATHADSADLPIEPPHLVLYDPFSPAKNPEMWTLAHFQALHGWLDPTRPCALATYSRSTMLRVTLLLAGFYVGAGHATGEKEETTIAANAVELIREPLERRWLARVRHSTSAEPLHEPVYRQARLAPVNWERLLEHPQFR